MEHISGRINMAPEYRDDRLAFTLVDQAGHSLRCRSGIDCGAAEPKKGDTVKLHGRLLIRARGSEFMYKGLEIARA